MNRFSELFTLSNISFMLGLIGSVGTVWQILQSRRKINVSLHYFGYNYDSGIALAYIQFDNLSNTAISITDVALLVGEMVYPCEKVPATVVSFKRTIGKKTSESGYLWNVQLPLCLSGYGGSSGYFLFQIPKESAQPCPTHQTLLISPSRGSSFRVEPKPDRVYFP